MPYIDHPLTVAALLIENGYGDEVLAAALLHDVVEKSETSSTSCASASATGRRRWSGR